MKRSKRINNIKKIRVLSEKEAMSKLAQALSAQQQVQLRYQDLIQFRKEYQHNMQQSGRQGIAASRILGFHQFLENLDRAIDQQAKQLAEQERLVQDLRLAWQQHRKALTGVENWMEQVLEQERKMDESKEQKELDELANRIKHQRKPY